MSLLPKLLLLAFGCILGMNAQGETFPHSFVVKEYQGAMTVVPVDKLHKITFGNNGVSLHLNDPSNTEKFKTVFDYGDVAVCFFSNQFAPTHIDCLDDESMTSIKVVVRGDDLYLIGLQSKSCVKIYSIGGLLHLSCRDFDPDQSINIGSLPDGMYILVVNYQVIKFIK